jgi:MraZ protein
VDFRFNGESEHTLDEKSRLVLPVRVRDPFLTAPGYLVRWKEGCLALWPQDRYFERLEELDAKVESGEEDRALLRIFGAGEKVTPDKANRILINSKLQEFAGIQGRVLVVGAYKVVELWDPERWDRVALGPGEQKLLGAAAT